MGLIGAFSASVSHDGRNVYVASLGLYQDYEDSSAVAVFDRAADGALSQKPGEAGCISFTGAPPCARGRALDGAWSATVSPDDGNVYVGAEFSDAVAVFDRAANGALTQKPGTGGCISNTGADGCAGGTALRAATSVTVSPDGENAYAASVIDSAVTVFDRGADGALTQKAGLAGCIADDGAGRCADGHALFNTRAVTISPDGETVYATASGFGAVTLLDRAADGALTQRHGSTGCVSEDGRGPCVDGTALQQAMSVAVSPAGDSLYVTSTAGDGAVAVFDRVAPDVTAPETSIVAGPGEGSETSEPTPTFQFTASEPGSTFRCAIDAGTPSACVSPFTLPALADGGHTFAVRATDAAGNVDPTPASRSFRVSLPVPPPPPPPPPGPPPPPPEPPPPPQPPAAAPPLAIVPFSAPLRRCVVPSLERKRVADARRALHKVNCTLGKVQRAKGTRRSDRTRVTGQRPKPGTSLPAGAKVDVIVRKIHRRRSASRR